MRVRRVEASNKYIGLPRKGRMVPTKARTRGDRRIGCEKGESQFVDEGRGSTSQWYHAGGREQKAYQKSETNVYVCT